MKSSYTIINNVLILFAVTHLLPMGAPEVFVKYAYHMIVICLFYSRS